MKFAVVIVALLIALIGSFTPSYARQTAAGSICVTAYTDLNKNGIHDANEGPLANVNVSLSQNSVVVANLFMDEKTGQEYCFRGLMPGLYTITASLPFATLTTPNALPYTLKAGERLNADFGAAPILETTPVPAGTISIPLTRPVRLGMALGGAVLVMGFLAAIGLVLRNLYLLGKRR